MKHPEIRISYSWLLAGGPSQVLGKEHGKQREWSDDDYEKWASAYRGEWAKYEKDILQGIQKTFGLEFYLPVIDAALAPWFVAQSDPLIMNFRNEPDQFVDSLAHELLHVLLTDNTTYSIKSSAQEIDLRQRWQALFGERDFRELVHIPVHAGLKYVFLDVLKDPSRLERDIKDCEHNPPYKAAWDYVQKNNYQDIITHIRDDFKNIKAAV